MCKSCLTRVLEWRSTLALRPRTYVFFFMAVFSPPLMANSLIAQHLLAAIGRKGTLLLTAFSATRDVAVWLWGLCGPVVYYFNNSALAFSIGNGDTDRTGGLLLMSTAVSLMAGTVFAIVCAIAARPLLELVTPAICDPTLLSDFAGDAMRIISLSLPGNIVSAGMSAALMALGYYELVGCIYLVWGAVGTFGGLIILSEHDCSLPEGLNETECGLAFNTSNFSVGHNASAAVVAAAGEETPVVTCGEESLEFLASSSWLAVACIYGTLVSFAVPVYRWSKQRGFFRRGLRLGSYYDFAGSWGRDNFWVAIRGVPANSRHIIALAICIRMGFTEAAVYVVIDDLSSLAYSIPNLLCSGSMSICAMYVGKGEYKNARAVLSMLRISAVVFAVLFTLLMSSYEVGGGSTVYASYASDAERDKMAKVASVVWPLVVAYQVPRVGNGVYAPLMVATRSFEFWGKLTMSAFIFLCLPCFVIGSLSSDLYMVVLGLFLYSSSIFLGSVYHIRRVSEGEYLKGAQKEAVATTSGGAGPKVAPTVASATSG